MQRLGISADSPIGPSTKRTATPRSGHKNFMTPLNRRYEQSSAARLRFENHLMTISPFSFSLMDAPKAVRGLLGMLPFKRRSLPYRSAARKTSRSANCERREYVF